MKATRIHLQVSSASPDLLAELAALPAGRPRAARLRALAELGLRVEQRLAAALAGAGAASLAAPASAAPPPPPAPSLPSDARAAPGAPATDLRRLVAEADPADLIGGLLDGV